MNKTEKQKLLRQLSWDYNLPEQEVSALLSGEIDHAGHYSQQGLFRKTLETYPWFTIIRLYNLQQIKELLSMELVNKLRTPSLRKQYAFIYKRLQEEGFLKLEFVNEVQYRSGSPFNAPFGQIDSPLNILSNKLTAILGRDEPKDVFDIVSIAENYSFQWMEVFFEAKNKAAINEIDLEERLVTFPIELIEQSDWLSTQSVIERFSRSLKTVSNDFLMGRENSLGTGKKNIKKATPDFTGYR